MRRSRLQIEPRTVERFVLCVEGATSTSEAIDECAEAGLTPSHLEAIEPDVEAFCEMLRSGTVTRRSDGVLTFLDVPVRLPKGWLARPGYAGEASK